MHIITGWQLKLSLSGFPKQCRDSGQVPYKKRVFINQWGLRALGGPGESHVQTPAEASREQEIRADLPHGAKRGLLRGDGDRGQPQPQGHRREDRGVAVQPKAVPGGDHAQNGAQVHGALLRLRPHDRDRVEVLGVGRGCGEEGDKGHLQGGGLQDRDEGLPHNQHRGQRGRGLPGAHKPPVPGEERAAE